MQNNTLRPCSLWLPAFLATLAFSIPALATSEGLNNIPTADSPPHRTLVFQTFSNFGPDRPADWFGGFKMGLRPWDQQFEWGLDTRFAEGDSEFAVLQGKYALQPWKNGPKFATGFTNLAPSKEQRRDAGQPFSFLLMSQDFKAFRGHAGYGLQHENDAAFFGLDKTIKLFDRDVMLRADAIQIQDQDQWMASAGFLYFLTKNVALESWISEPLEQGKPIYTIKLNLIWKF